VKFTGPPTCLLTSSTCNRHRRPLRKEDMTCQGCKGVHQCPHPPCPALMRFCNPLRFHSVIRSALTLQQVNRSDQIVFADCDSYAPPVTRLRSSHYKKGLSGLFLSEVNKCHDVLCAACATWQIVLMFSQWSEEELSSTLYRYHCVL
jgi:hypothetical protein